MNSEQDPAVGEGGVTADAALAELLDIFGKCDEQLATLHETVPILQEDVAELARVLRDHIARWAEPDDELAAWVNGWLIPTFSLDVELQDWESNPAIASELKALRQGYGVVAEAKEASFEPLAWHDYLAKVRERISGHRSRQASARNRRRTAAPSSPITPSEPPARSATSMIAAQRGRRMRDPST